MILKFFTICAAFFLAGCSSPGIQQNQGFRNGVNFSGVGGDLSQVTQEISPRDGMPIVNLPPMRTSAENGQMASGTRMGAVWTGGAPDNVALIFMSPAVGGELQTVDVSVDGSVSRYSPRPLTGPEFGGYNQPRSSAIVVPYALLQRMATGRSVRVRIYGPRGYEDSFPSIQRLSNGQPLVGSAFYEFLTRVDNLRKNRR